MAEQTKSKDLIRPMPRRWWLKHPGYRRYMLREFSSVFIAGYGLFMLVLMYRAAQSPDAFKSIYECLSKPLSLGLHSLALLFALYNSYTFCNIAPRVFPVFRGEEKMPDAVIVGFQYVTWAVISLVLIVIVLLA